MSKLIIIGHLQGQYSKVTPNNDVVGGNLFQNNDSVRSNKNVGGNFPKYLIKV